MKRRSGMTLIEVLVAIFIMAVGLLALLTLFPLGMLRMAQAIRDDRCSQAAINAHALSIMNDVRNDLVVVKAINDPYNKNATTDDLFVNPSKLHPVTGLPYPAAGTLPDADPYGESYPILVDHIGYLNSPPLSVAQDWVGGVRGILRRRPVSFAPPPLDVYKNFTLWDDMSFDSINIPGTPEKVGAAVMRDTRYSWAYLLRRPQRSNKSIVDCTVIVFDQRSLSLSQSLQLEEYVYTGNTISGTPYAFFNPSNSTITLDSTGYVPPPIRPGDWILDTTFYTTKPGTGSANAFFYRVVAMDDLGTGQFRFEVQQPIRGWPAKMAPGGYAGTAIVIPGVAEVFEKGPARVP